MKPNPVVHFELPAKDIKRMSKFYQTAFGWGAQSMGAEMGEYEVVTTTESDAKTGRPTTPGAINGGLYKMTEDEYSQHPSVVISVDDLDESMQKTTDAGGTIHGEPYDIPGIGRYVSIVDTEGNRVSLLQPSPDMEGKK